MNTGEENSTALIFVTDSFEMMARDQKRTAVKMVEEHAGAAVAFCESTKQRRAQERSRQLPPQRQCLI